MASKTNGFNGFTRRKRGKYNAKRKRTTISELAELTKQDRHTVAKQLKEQSVDLTSLESIIGYVIRIARKPL